jgi:hypothetical protein
MGQDTQIPCTYQFCHTSLRIPSSQQLADDVTPMQGNDSTYTYSKGSNTGSELVNLNKQPADSLVGIKCCATPPLSTEFWKAMLEKINFIPSAQTSVHVHIAAKQSRCEEVPSPL